MNRLFRKLPAVPVPLAFAPVVAFALSLAFAATVSGCGGSDANDGVPDNAYCNPVADWPSEFRVWENRMLELMNEARSEGATCGSTYYGPTHSLAMNPALRCAGRVHSKDMHDRQFFDHTNPDGEGPAERFTRAGYAGSGWGENIVAGYGTAEASFSGWMGSPGHCSNIMNPSFDEVGIGFFSGPNGYGNYATAGFGAQ